MQPRRLSHGPRPPFRVTRHGIPIREVGLKRPVNPNIAYGFRYSSWDACVSCGLDLWTWAKGDYPEAKPGEYPERFKVDVIAFHGLRALVIAHIEDAKASALGRKKR